MKNPNHIFRTIIVGIACFALLPIAQAVEPAVPDTALPGGNTADGQLALASLTTGIYNSAFGIYSLLSLTDADFCTGVGAGALFSNNANENTATGAGALFSNTTGSNNTANGAFALFSNSTGQGNTAIGVEALLDNTGGEFNTATGLGALTHNINGSDNTANGIFALHDNTGGSENVAIGMQALAVNDTGDDNTATGFQALFNNISGSSNTAVGHGALFANIDGFTNTAIGFGALAQNSSGGDNTALGAGAGNTLTTGSGNVFIGAAAVGFAGNEMDHTYIRNINTTTVSGGGTDFVTVDLVTGLLGHASSSRRYKEKITPMNDASEVLYRLKPVSYRYKKEIDSTQSPAFGLIAEEVAEVNPDLVARNVKGQPESVHYEMVNAMLLNEFLKEHCKVQAQEATIARLQKEIETVVEHAKEQDAQIQRVTAQVEVRTSGPQVVKAP